MQLRFTALALALAASCSSLGPSNVRQDQFDYNAAIAVSDQEQLLLNLVRLRYNETPVFLEVSSVISQYEQSGSVNTAGTLNGALTGDDTASLGGAYTWAERPTVTYTPITGQQFARNLLTPIRPTELIGLILAGWPAELVLSSAVWSFSGLRNEVARPSGRRNADAGLVELFDVWSDLAAEGVIGSRTRKLPSGELEYFILLRDDRVSEDSSADLARYRELLGLAPGVSEVPLRFGLLPEGASEVTLLTGSIWDIMLQIAWQFEVPEEHLESGRTGETFQSQYREGVPLIELEHSRERPDDAFVQVYFQDHWFYIGEDDRNSKRAFAFLQLLLNLTQSDASGRGPMVTISS